MLFVTEDWRVRVFGTSGILYRSPECLSKRTTHISGCMGRRYSYKRMFVFTYVFYCSFTECYDFVNHSIFF